MYSKDFTKVLLAEVLRNYDQPISEEQAWAICFQSCCTMKVIVAQGLNSNSEIQKIVLRDVDDLYIHSDGSVSFTVQHNLNDSFLNQQPSDRLEEKLTEQLGKLIYKALDWGIESHLERELSESLEKLIAFMLKLNTEASKPALAFQDVIKICEDHFIRPAEAASHYTVVCKLLFTNYIEFQQLMFSIQSYKEYLGRLDMEDCSPRQKAKHQAGLWQDVLGDLQKGVRLCKAMEQPTWHRIPPPGLTTTSPYNTVVDDIKHRRYTLHQASARKLKEKVHQEPTLHEQLMMEVKNPPKLRPTFFRKNGNEHKDQSFSTRLVFSKAKKPRLSWIQSVPNSKLSSIDDQNLSPRWPLPTIADMMGTRHAAGVTEIKDSRQRDSHGQSSRAQVCLVCHNELFIWPYLCHLCHCVSCENCCAKMSMPFRPCVRFPLNFFKALRLGKDEDQALQDQKILQLLEEIEHWAYSRIPLVFEPHCLSPPLASRTQSMMDWPSMDICVQCEHYLLEILSQEPQHQPSAGKDPCQGRNWNTGHSLT